MGRPKKIFGTQLTKPVEYDNPNANSDELEPEAIPIRVLRRDAIRLGARLKATDDREVIQGYIDSLGPYEGIDYRMDVYLNKGITDTHSNLGIKFKMNEVGRLTIVTPQETVELGDIDKLIDELIEFREVSDHLFNDAHDELIEKHERELQTLIANADYTGLDNQPPASDKIIQETAKLYGISGDMNGMIIALAGAYGIPIGESIAPEDALPTDRPDGKSRLFPLEKIRDEVLKAIEAGPA